MSDNSLSQNETFQLMGTYVSLPQLAPKSIDENMHVSMQIKLLEENILNCGIIKTATEWDTYTDPFIRCALKLSASGVEKSVVKDLITVSVFVNDDFDINKQLEIINQILSIVFCKKIIRGL